MSPIDLSLPALQSAYRSGRLSPAQLIEHLYPSLQAATYPASPEFLHLASKEELLAAAEALEAVPAERRGPLWGVPCAVKDNVDVGGMPTTAACPAFSYTPESSAVGVKALQDAGVLVVGKTNMDQFAAGLVGTRSPYGAPATPFDRRFISGGSSSGSAVVVAVGLVTFALGTDTAGSGRVPAGLCGCVGIKGTVGSISTVGVVPACASLDCLTVFARSVEEGALVARTMRAAQAGARDVWRRPPPPPAPAPPSVGFRFAVPPLSLSDWGGPGGPAAAAAAAELFAQAAQRLESLGGVRVEVDFEPFASVAAMLYGTAFVGERYSGIRAFLEAAATKGTGAEAEGKVDVARDQRLLPVTRTIIAGASKFSAADVYDANATLAVRRAAALEELDKVDVLLVPTALAHYTQQEVLEEEGADPPRWTQNANLGRFTNFVNLLDMCGVAVPSGLIKLDAEQAAQQAAQAAQAGTCSPEVAAAAAKRAEHLRSTPGGTRVTLPFGVTLLTAGWRDEWLWGVAAAMHRASGLGCGVQGHGLPVANGV